MYSQKIGNEVIEPVGTAGMVDLFSPDSRTVFRDTMNAELDRLELGIKFVAGKSVKRLTEKARAKSFSPVADPAVNAEFFIETIIEIFKHVAIPPPETPTKVRPRGGSYGYGGSRGEFSAAAAASVSRAGCGESRGGSVSSLPGPARGGHLLGRPKGEGRQYV